MSGTPQSGGNHRQEAAPSLQEEQLLSGGSKEARLGTAPRSVFASTERHPDGRRVRVCVCVRVRAHTHTRECSQKANAECSWDQEVWRWAKAYFCNVSEKDSSVSGTRAPSSLILALLESHYTIVIRDYTY